MGGFSFGLTGGISYGWRESELPGREQQAKVNCCAASARSSPGDDHNPAEESQILEVRCLDRGHFGQSVLVCIRKQFQPVSNLELVIDGSQMIA